MRWAARRVVWVWWASQFAVEVAPVWPATSTVSAWVSSRVLSSASWASARSTSSITAVVSAASIDHNGTSATCDSWSRTAATAPVTRWAWCAVAVMEPIQAPTTDTPPARKPVLHKGNRRSRGGFETVAARPPQPPAATAAMVRPSVSPPGFETVAARPPQPPAATGGSLCPQGIRAPCRGFETVAARPPQPPAATAAMVRPSVSPPGFETVAARPPQPSAREANATTRPEQPRPGGNPIASPPVALTGAVNPPREPQGRHPRLTAPGSVRHWALGLPTYSPRGSERVAARPPQPPATTSRAATPQPRRTGARYQVPGDAGSGCAASWMTYAVPPEPPSQAASSCARS